MGSLFSLLNKKIQCHFFATYIHTYTYTHACTGKISKIDLSSSITKQTKKNEKLLRPISDSLFHHPPLKITLFSALLPSTFFSTCFNCYHEDEENIHSCVH